MAIALLLFADPFINSLLQTATLDSMTRDVLSISTWVLSPFGVVGGLVVLIGWVALSRRNA